jgi:hypothetical protein
MMLIPIENDLVAAVPKHYPELPPIASVAMHESQFWLFQGETLKLQLGGKTEKRKDFFISDQLKSLSLLMY